uniref:Uncharacterized protein n=1 Tax=Arion vulgaris TaxID=1028688 RepID=A0A0B7BBH9_9EUPU
MTKTEFKKQTKQMLSQLQTQNILKFYAKNQPSSSNSEQDITNRAVIRIESLQLERQNCIELGNCITHPSCKLTLQAGKQEIVDYHDVATFKPPGAIWITCSES